MTTRVPTLCAACDRFRAGKKCEAFSKGIPVDIVLFGADHREPIDGDHGVQFVKKSGSAAQKAFEDWRFVFGA
jgi:hypothetical protein